MRATSHRLAACCGTFCVAKNGSEVYDDEVIVGTRYVSMMIRLRPGDDRAEPTCFQRRNSITSAPCIIVPPPQKSAHAAIKQTALGEK